MKKKIDGRHKDTMSKEMRSKIARLGGLAVSKNKKHMREIGSKGGKA